MSKKTVIVFLIYLYAIIGPGFALFAQNNADTLLLKAGKEIYDNPKKAIRLGLQVYEDGKSDSEHKILALITVSNAYFSMKQSKEAKKYAFKALSLAQETHDYANQVKVYGLIGNHYQVLKINEKARLYLGKAEAIMQNHALPPDMRYIKGNIFAVKGNSYKNDLDCDYAITYFDKAINEFKQATNTSAVTNLNLVQVQKGFCLLEKQMPDAAAAIFREVLKNTSATLRYDGWIYAKIGMARSHLINKEYNAAIAELDTALAATDSARVTIRHELYRNLSAGYLNLGNDAKYRFYNTLYYTTFKEVNDAENDAFNILINDLTAEAESRIDETTATHRKYLFILFFTAIALIIVAAFVLRQKQIKVNKFKKDLFRKTLNS